MGPEEVIGPETVPSVHICARNIVCQRSVWAVCLHCAVLGDELLVGGGQNSAIPALFAGTFADVAGLIDGRRRTRRRNVDRG